MMSLAYHQRSVTAVMVKGDLPHRPAWIRIKAVFGPGTGLGTSWSSRLARASGDCRDAFLIFWLTCHA